VSTQPTPLPLARPAGVLAAIEAVALVAYCVALGIAGLNSSGATQSAPIVEIIIYLIFAVGIGFIARGSFNGSRTARPPYLLTQVFVLIIGYTLLVGDGAAVKLVGSAVGLLGLIAMGVGIASIIKEEPPEYSELPELPEEPRSPGSPGSPGGENV
jgi:hypothetical protein